MRWTAQMLEHTSSLFPFCSKCLLLSNYQIFIYLFVRFPLLWSTLKETDFNIEEFEDLFSKKGVTKKKKALSDTIKKTKAKKVSIGLIGLIPCDKERGIQVADLVSTMLNSAGKLVVTWCKASSNWLLQSYLYFA